MDLVVSIKGDSMVMVTLSIGWPSSFVIFPFRESERWPVLTIFLDLKYSSWKVASANISMVTNLSIRNNSLSFWVKSSAIPSVKRVRVTIPALVFGKTAL